MRRSSASANVVISAARSLGWVLGHGPCSKAFAADAIARSISSAVAIGTSASVLPSAGLTSSFDFDPVALTQWPPTKSCRGCVLGVRGPDLSLWCPLLQLGPRIHVDDRLGKGSRCLLGKIVTDAARDQAVLIFSDELACIGLRIGMRRAVGIAFHSDRGDGQFRSRRELCLVFVEPLFSRSQPEAPSIVMGDDFDMVWVCERGRRLVESGVVELPLRGGELPDQLGEIVRVLRVTLAPTFSCEIVLIPPLELGGRG